MIRRGLLALALCLATTGAQATGYTLASCGSLPFFLTNGTLADATQVMANFNALLTCILTTGGVTAVPISGPGGGTITIQNPSATGNYNDKLPATAGTAGQLATSGGGGTNPQTWTTIPTASFLGGAGLSGFVGLTGTQATALLNVFTSSLQGLAPASGGGTTNFLRADGSWASPSGAAKQRLAIGWPTGIDPASNVIATVDEASTVSSIVGSVATPVGATATLSVYKAPSGAACSGGTVLHSGTFNANGTANTNQTLTLTTTALSSGDRICLVTTNGANWVAGSGIGGVTVRMTTP